MDTSRFELGRKLFGEMIKKGWTMTELSKRADVPRPLVVDLVFSEKAVDQAVIRKIADTLGVDPTGILTIG